MLSQLNFNGQAIVVTGAAHGIGRATCAVLTEMNARVYAIDIRPDFEETVDKDRVTYGQNGVAIVADVSVEDQVSSLRDRIESEVESLAAVVNVVGAEGNRQAVRDMALNEWSRVIEISLTSMFLMSRALLPLVERATGSFVNVASTHALVGLPLGNAYSTAKAGVIGFTRQLATEVGSSGVRANSVCPGPVDTASPSGHNPESVMSTVLGRFADASEIANLIGFLASPASSFMTGTAVVIDGGQTAHRGLVDLSRRRR